MHRQFLFSRLLIWFLFFPLFSWSQSVGIGTTTPDSSALLEVRSSNKGFLPPRMTAAERRTINRPASGLLVYQMDGSQGYYYFDGLNWINLSSGQVPDYYGNVPISWAAINDAKGVSNFAGSGLSNGPVEGPDTLVNLDGLNTLLVDPAGNVVIGASNRILKVQPGGFVSVFAGGGPAGTLNGPRLSVELQGTNGMCFDAQGNLYFTNYLFTYDGLVKKINTAGIVSTVAGGGVGDGQDTLAGFNSPRGIEADNAGNLYVADVFGYNIRRISPSGYVTTFAGTAEYGNPQAGYTDGPDSAARFRRPHGLVIDRAGNLFVTDITNHVVRKITPTGVVSTFAGSKARIAGYADGPDTTARFHFPTGLAIDADDNLYVGDVNNRRIRKITPAGLVSTLAGSGATGSANGSYELAQFSSVIPSLTVDAGGTVYVADAGNRRVRKITPPNPSNPQPLIGNQQLNLTGNTLSITGGNAINLPFASSSSMGLLTAADWNHFNSKYTLPSLTNGGVIFASGNNLAQTPGQFYWDNSANRLGIGTSSPQAPLHVGRATSSTPFNNTSVVYSRLNVVNLATNVTGALAPANGQVSIVAEGDIVGKGTITVASALNFSDARLKRLTGRSNSADDLRLLKQLRVTNYSMIDRVSDPYQYKRLVAQEVEEVLPQAVRKQRGVVPDVYALAEKVGGNCLQLPAGKPSVTLAKGSRLRVLDEKGERMVTVVDVEGSRLCLEPLGQPFTGAVFVYGREVDDLRAVDYEAISMLNVSATQELVRKVEAMEQTNGALAEQLKTIQQHRRQLRQQLDQLGRQLSPQKNKRSKKQPSYPQ